MGKEPVFYSFDYDTDVFRVQQIRNMGVVAGDEPVSPNEWEQLKRSGDASVERWINEKMNYKRCVIVLIGSRTANRPWVKYEIKRAWELKKGLFGIHIHNLKCPRSGTCSMGANPFRNIDAPSMTSSIPCYDPNSWDAYNDISRNLTNWVSQALQTASYR